MYKWRLEAQCKGTDASLFIAEKWTPVEKQYFIDQEAIAICKVCIVREECAEYAICNPSLVTIGTWGGMTFKLIEKERRKRNRRK